MKTRLIEIEITDCMSCPKCSQYKLFINDTFNLCCDELEQKFEYSSEYHYSFPAFCPLPFKKEVNE